MNPAHFTTPSLQSQILELLCLFPVFAGCLILDWKFPILQSLVFGDWIQCRTMIFKFQYAMLSMLQVPGCFSDFWLRFANPHGTGNFHKFHEIAPSKLWSCFKKPSLGLTRGRQAFNFARTSCSDVGLLFLDS